MRRTEYYETPYKEGMRYCQYPECPNHLNTHHLTDMNNHQDYVFCSYECITKFIEYYERRKKINERLNWSLV